MTPYKPKRAECPNCFGKGRFQEGGTFSRWVKCDVCMRQPKKPVYRIGDHVKIVNPIFVKRCGYPWDKDHVLQHVITMEQRDAITKMLEAFNIRPYYLGNGHSTYDAAFEKILNEMAYWVLKTQRFGGKERTLHTEEKTEHKDKIAVVRGKRVVKTGTYFAPSSYIDYWSGGTEYDNGGLKNEKTHVLLDLEIFTDNDCWSIHRDPMEIEASNVTIHKRIKKWKASLHPNNQPTIELGTVDAFTKEEAIRNVCNYNRLRSDDDCLCVKEVKE